MIKENSIIQKELAERLKIHPVSLNAILRGRSRASIVLALKIEDESGGIIKAEDLRPELKR